MSRILLDTSAYIAFRKGHPLITARIEEADEVGLSAVSLGELFAGFRKGTHQRVNEKGLHEFLDAPGVSCIPVLRETAECFALIRNTLREAGAPVSTHDVWIASTAMERGYRLLTTDADFLKIPQILVEHHPR